MTSRLKRTIIREVERDFGQMARSCADGVRQIGPFVQGRTAPSVTDIRVSGGRATAIVARDEGAREPRNRQAELVRSDEEWLVDSLQ